MDILSDVLRAVRLTGAIFFNNYVQAPFVGGSPHTGTIASRVMPGAEHVIQFHALLSGSCWARFDGRAGFTARTSMQATSSSSRWVTAIS